jgi:hypothetical protein
MYQYGIDFLFHHIYIKKVQEHDNFRVAQIFYPNTWIIII